jgi:hypothetical protein
MGCSCSSLCCRCLGFLEDDGVRLVEAAIAPVEGLLLPVGSGELVGEKHRLLVVIRVMDRVERQTERQRERERGLMVCNVCVLGGCDFTGYYPIDGCCLDRSLAHTTTSRAVSVDFDLRFLVLG